MSVFLSYTTKDLEIAKKIFTALTSYGYSVWFAPRSISPSDNFADEIANSLLTDKINDEDIIKNADNLQKAQAFVLVLSGASMKSPWVSRELISAINENIRVFALRTDNSPLTPQFKYLLSQCQILDAYYLKKDTFEIIRNELVKNGITPSKTSVSPHKEQLFISREKLNIELIAQGDPFYTVGETLKTWLSKKCFFIAPPLDLAELGSEDIDWINQHINNPPQTLGVSWKEIFENIPIPDLYERIEQSRKKVLLQFINHENGCYFNNLKYGVYSINPFERTEDYSERPILSIKFYTTDYYTHRVMKDVCKQLISEKNEYITGNIDFFHLSHNRIFFTSLGINLLLLEDELSQDRKLILTGRSSNAAESNEYKDQKLSVSVVEGVSNSDYDPFTGNVDLSAAAFRGLEEELGLQRHLMQQDTLHFYDLFVNRTNLEMGISCSVELNPNITIEQDVLKYHGKDEQLELSDKNVISHDVLRDYTINNIDRFMPQAAYTICSYLEAIGSFIIQRFNKSITHKEKFTMSREGTEGICGDSIVDTDNFIAVIDGATPKGNRLWEGMRGDVYISHLISNAIKNMDRDITAEDAVLYINNAVKDAYKRNNVDLDTLEHEEMLQACVVIYSASRHEVWSYGDCLIRINHRDYNNIKKLDVLMSNLRAFFIESAMINGNYHYDSFGEDFGRKCILPYLKEQGIFANTNYSFGYSVINGGTIIPKNVKVYSVQSGDRIILATDGYPKLFDTLEASEQYLELKLKEDPDCVYSLRGTKGVSSGNVSFDDRAFIGFSVD